MKLGGRNILIHSKVATKIMVFLGCDAVNFGGLLATFRCLHLLGKSARRVVKNYKFIGKKRK
jgi:hypothetical protein